MGEKLAIESGNPVRETYLPYGHQWIDESDIEAVVEVLRSDWVTTGPKVAEFEAKLADYVGAKYAVVFSSGTAALHAAVFAARIGPGDEVITTPMTFAATANVIVHHGARPVFVDVERETMNIDPSKIEEAVTPRTKAIIPVHMAGRPCKMDEIIDIARRHDLVVIEDAAHAVEAWYKDRKIGNIGDITAFSFYVTKNVTTGEGGMVTTNNDQWAEEMRIRSLHGISKDAWKRYSAEGFQPYETIYPGYKFNMTDIQASLGIHQLARVEENLKIREKYWRMYNEAFAELPEIITPIEEEGIRHARHLYTILIRPEMLTINRNQFIEALKAENIGTGIHYTALHLHKYYREAFGYKRGDFPNAEFIGDRTISLPLSPKLTDDDVADVIAAVQRVARYYQR